MSGVLSSGRVRVNMGKVPWIFNSKTLVLIDKAGRITINQCVARVIVKHCMFFARNIYVHTTINYANSFEMS